MTRYETRPEKVLAVWVLELKNAGMHSPTGPLSRRLVYGRSSHINLFSSTTERVRSMLDLLILAY
jgi:hypothetical protein